MGVCQLSIGKRIDRKIEVPKEPMQISLKTMLIATTYLAVLMVGFGGTPSHLRIQLCASSFVSIAVGAIGTFAGLFLIDKMFQTFGTGTLASFVLIFIRFKTQLVFGALVIGTIYVISVLNELLLIGNVQTWFPVPVGFVLGIFLGWRIHINLKAAKVVNHAGLTENKS